MAAVLVCSAAVSCSTDEYEPGQEDMDGCPDVYFNTGQSGDFSFNQTEDITLTFNVSRVDTGGSFVVPLEVSGPEGIIDVSPLMFREGEASARITVRVISNMEIQKEYGFVISIPAPEYAAIYGLNETSLTFSIIREDYVRVGTGTFRSELFNDSFNNIAFEYSQILDTYRIVSPWVNGGNVVFKWDGAGTVTFEEGASFYISQITDSYTGTVYAAYAQPEEASYDPATRTFTFNFWYAIPAEGENAGFGYSEDTFTLND